MFEELTMYASMTVVVGGVQCVYQPGEAGQPCLVPHLRCLHRNLTFRPPHDVFSDVKFTALELQCP